MKNPPVPLPTIIDSLQLLGKMAEEKKEIPLSEIFQILSGKGYPILLVLFSFPFCFPIQIPGFSTPFGIILCFIGLRIAFIKHLWWPEWILKKRINSRYIKSLAKHTIKGIIALKKWIHPRLFILTQNPLFHCLHGLLVFVLSILLSLPLPIPFSNMLAAFPIFFIGLGLLEEDGVVIIIAYILATVCFLAFFALFYFGKHLFS